MKHTFYTSVLISILTACTVHAPQQYEQSGAAPELFPDYRDITVPSNIAPLNFKITSPGERFITVFTCGDYSVTLKGMKTDMPSRKWDRLKSCGNTIKVEVFARKSGKWSSHSPFSITLAEPIDRYISYRIIPPGYQSYQQLTLNQRDLTSFKEKIILCNSLVQSANTTGSCINCHHYRNYRTDNMQFHVREGKAGTILVLDGEIHKINLKTDSTRSAGVYPAWHPTHDYIAYSNNQTRQAFFLYGNNRIQGFDTFSDLVLYDIKSNTVSIIENAPDEFECYPTWSPDGRTLFYVSAHIILKTDSDGRPTDILDHLQDFHYDLYMKPFDPETGTWGTSRKIIDAQASNTSITLPRVSPDGKYLMFAMGSHGVLHLYNKDADLYLMNLTNGKVRNLHEINSDEAESYHSWSSNGKWLIFSTRRDNGVVTRPYIAYMNDDGTFTKPFALPQKDPDYSIKFMNAFNVPEFMIEPVRINQHKFARYINRHSSEPVGFRAKKENPSLR